MRQWGEQRVSAALSLSLCFLSLQSIHEKNLKDKWELGFLPLQAFVGGSAVEQVLLKKLSFRVLAGSVSSHGQPPEHKPLPSALISRVFTEEATGEDSHAITQAYI